MEEAFSPKPAAEGENFSLLGSKILIEYCPENRTWPTTGKGVTAYGGDVELVKRKVKGEGAPWATSAVTKATCISW